MKKWNGEVSIAVATEGAGVPVISPYLIQLIHVSPAARVLSLFPMSFAPSSALRSSFNLVSPNLLSPTMRSRARRGSIVKVEEVGSNSLEESQDQGAFPDHNSEWVNRKGTRSPIWRSHFNSPPSQVHG